MQYFNVCEPMCIQAPSANGQMLGERSHPGQHAAVLKGGIGGRLSQVGSRTAQRIALAIAMLLWTVGDQISSLVCFNVRTEQVVYNSTGW